MTEPRSLFFRVNHKDGDISITPKLTRRVGAFSINGYYDPEDGQPFDDGPHVPKNERLSPREKGHLYLWTDEGTGKIAIHMPKRVIDKETAYVLLKTKSYKTRVPNIANYARIPLSPTALTHPSTGVQDFEISQEDFEKIFLPLAKKYGWEVKEEALNVGALSDEIRGLLKDLKDVVAAVRDIHRRRIESGCPDPIKTGADYNDVVLEVQQVDVALDAARDARVRISREVERIRQNKRLQGMYTLLTADLEALNGQIKATAGVDTKRLLRAATQRLRASQGEATVEAFKPTISGILLQLKEHYPEIGQHFFSAGNSEVQMTLKGCTFLFTEEGVKLTGDPRSLEEILDTPIQREQLAEFKTGTGRLKALKKNPTK